MEVEAFLGSLCQRGNYSKPPVSCSVFSRILPLLTRLGVTSRFKCQASQHVQAEFTGCHVWGSELHLRLVTNKGCDWRVTHLPHRGVVTKNSPPESIKRIGGGPTFRRTSTEETTRRPDLPGGQRSCFESWSHREIIAWIKPFISRTTNSTGWSIISAPSPRRCGSRVTPGTATPHPAASAPPLPSQPAACTSPMTSSSRTMWNTGSWRGSNLSSVPEESAWTPSTSPVREAVAARLPCSSTHKRCCCEITFSAPVCRYGRYTWGRPVREPGVRQAAGPPWSRYSPEGRGGMDPAAHGLQRWLPTYCTVSPSLKMLLFRCKITPEDNVIYAVVR